MNQSTERVLYTYNFKQFIMGKYIDRMQYILQLRLIYKAIFQDILFYFASVNRK